MFVTHSYSIIIVSIQFFLSKWTLWHHRLYNILVRLNHNIDPTQKGNGQIYFIGVWAMSRMQTMIWLWFGQNHFLFPVLQIIQLIIVICDIQV